MNVSLDELTSSMIDRLVDELDPRIHVATRAFFELLRPDAANQIAEHYNRYNRLQVETAFHLRRITMNLQEAVNEMPRDFLAYAHDLLGSIYPGAVQGFEAVEGHIAALRGDLDDGIASELDRLSLDAAQRLLTDEGWKEQVNKQLELTNA